VVTESHAVAHEAHGHHDPLLHHHFDDMVQQRECTGLGMWLFLATEAMMFGGLFFTYSLYRSHFPMAFHEGSHHLNIVLGTANTFVLLFSSLTMAMSVWYATTQQKNRLIFWLCVTWLLGASFIGIKGVEWTTDYREGLVPALQWNYYQRDEPENQKALQEITENNTTPDQVMMYFVVYFCMTGLHAIHMIIGLAVVAYYIFLARKGHFTIHKNDQPVELVGLYWHFVDIIWIFLFPLLYLIAGFHPFGGG
jgi:cytochrome c oxidase subunit 3